MQKKLIAIAIAAAFAPAVAMADTSNVTVYGIADASFDNVKAATLNNNSVTNNKVSSNASRLGLKGSEDLGGGLKAIWQIESAVSIDGAANNTLATRNTFVGLAGDAWGSLTLGRNDTPYKSSTRALDVFADHIADNRSLMGVSTSQLAGLSTTSAFDGRFTDTVRYDSPSFSGFKVAGSYTLSAEGNNNPAANSKGRAVSLSGNYETGPFSAAAAYQKHYLGSTTGAIPAAGLGGAPLGPLAANLTSERAWKLGAGYKVSQFAVNGVYEKTTDNLGVNGGGHKAFYLAGAFNATANDAIKLAYTKAKQLGDGSMNNSGAKQWSLGVDHNMSKRTTVYAMYTKLDNDGTAADGAQYGLSAATGATGATGFVSQSTDPSAFSFGMKHVF